MENHIKNLIGLLHPVAHILGGLIAVLLVLPPRPEYLIAAALAGLLPDLDSSIGLPHRAQSHSVTIIGILYLIYTSEKDGVLLIAIMAGYTSHLFVDLLHGNGIMLFWPATRRYFSMANFQPSVIAIALVLPLIMLIQTRFERPILVDVMLSTLPELTRTATPTRTTTPTRTPPPTKTKAISYSAEIALLRWQQLRHTPGPDAALAYLQYCQTAQIAPCETPIPSITPTQSGTRTETPPAWQQRQRTKEARLTVTITPKP